MAAERALEEARRSRLAEEQAARAQNRLERLEQQRAARERAKEEAAGRAAAESERRRRALLPRGDAGLATGSALRRALRRPGLSTVSEAQQRNVERALSKLPAGERTNKFVLPDDLGCRLKKHLLDELNRRRQQMSVEEKRADPVHRQLRYKYRKASSVGPVPSSEFRPSAVPVAMDSYDLPTADWARRQLQSQPTLRAGTSGWPVSCRPGP